MTVEKKLNIKISRIIDFLYSEYGYSMSTLRKNVRDLYIMAIDNKWDDDEVAMDDCKTDIMSKYEDFKTLAKYGYPMSDKRPNYSLYLGMLYASLMI